MRTVKTGLAVIVTLAVSSLGLVINPIYATLGTVLVMQQTIRDSFLTAKNRLLGTAIGGLIAYLIALKFAGNDLLIGVGVIVVICVCNKLKLSEGISIALTVLLSILIEIETNNPLVYSTIRVWDTSIGVLIGVLINYCVAQPNYKKAMEEKLSVFNQSLNQLVLEKDCLFTIEELGKFKDQMHELDASYRQYIADLPFQSFDGSKELEEVLDLCHDAYFHAKSLCLLDTRQLDVEVLEQFVYYHRSCLLSIQQQTKLDF